MVYLYFRELDLKCREQAAKEAIVALGSDIPKPEFLDLSAGWETFQKTGVALPKETVRYLTMSSSSYGR